MKFRDLFIEAGSILDFGAGLGMAGKSGFSSLVVVDQPRHYPRFGFVAASRWDIISPWELPEDVFMDMKLTGDVLKGVCGKVIFSSVFHETI